MDKTSSSNYDISSESFKFQHQQIRNIIFLNFAFLSHVMGSHQYSCFDMVLPTLFGTCNSIDRWQALAFQYAWMHHYTVEWPPCTISVAGIQTYQWPMSKTWCAYILAAKNDSHCLLGMCVVVYSCIIHVLHHHKCAYLITHLHICSDWLITK